MKTPKPVKRHLTLRLAPDEVLELVQLRQALEQTERKAVTLQASLRVAILAAHGGAKLDFSRASADRDERMELIADESVSKAVDAAQEAHPDESHSSIVLACVRATRKVLDSKLKAGPGRRKTDHARP